MVELILSKSYFNLDNMSFIEVQKMTGREKRRRVDPKADAISHIKDKSDKLDSLEALYINAEKGRGVFAKRPFNQGDFILEYRGDLISDTEAQRRRAKSAEVPPRTQCDSAALDVVAVPSTESALNTPPATVRGISSCPELCDKKPAERPPRTSPDSALLDKVAVPMEQPTESALNTPPATVEGVSSCPEPSDKISTDKKAAEQTKRKTLGKHRTIKKKQKNKSAEVPPRTQCDSAALDMVAVPSTESALNTPPATVRGISSCPELCDKKPAERPPRTSPDSALLDKVAVPMEQPTESALNTPPATVEGVSSCPEPSDKKSAEVPPRTQCDSAALDVVAVPSTESALNTPPATVRGISSCPELCDKKPAERPPRTSPDSALLDMVAVPSTESALNTPPATVEGVSSCPEPSDKKSAEVPPRTQCDSAALDVVAVPSTESALNTPLTAERTKRKTLGKHRTIKKKQKNKSAEVPPRTQRDSAALDKVAVPSTETALNTPLRAEQTKRKTRQHQQQTKKKQDKLAVDHSSDELDGTVDQLGDESEWDSSSVDMGEEYIPPKGECEDSTDDSNASEEFFDDMIDLTSKQKAKEKRTTKKGHTVSSKSRAPESVPTLTPDKEEVQGEDKMGEEDSEIRGGEDSETEGMSETRLSNTLPPEIPTQMEVSSSGISSSKKERRPTTKKPWTKEESSAVDRSMSQKFIEKFVVPGKNDCIACINANPEALKERDWRAVKFHVKNKITALKRKAFSR
ncbi:hypothetical protein INR49_002689 [Caranx melampygus]|nr:hypothetical protein INR49_002689 [Caranx melampygus]